MKRTLQKFALLGLALATLLTVGCDDNNKGVPGKKFTSELIGNYTPTFVEVPTEGGALNKMYFQIPTTWNDPENIPTVDMSFMLGFPAGSFLMPVNEALPFVEAIVSNFVQNGLVGLELKNDGTFGAQYRTPIFTDDILQDLVKGPKFSEEIFTFPNAETEELIPAGALTYYTEDGMLFLSLSKTFLASIDPDTNIAEMLEALITEYALPIVTTEEAYALPLKYTIKDSVVTVYVDKEMMAPFVPLIKELVMLLPDADQTGGIDLKTFVPDLLDKLFNNTKTVDIKIYLAKK